MPSRLRSPKTRHLSLLATLLLAGCGSAGDRALQMFVMSDIQNAEFISAQAGLTGYSACLHTLEPVAVASPDPTNDGILTLGARKMALVQAVYGPCGSVLAPLLLEKLGKAAGPFGLLLPF